MIDLKSWKRDRKGNFKVSPGRLNISTLVVKPMAA